MTSSGKRTFYRSKQRGAKFFGWSKTTIQDAFKELVDEGWLEILNADERDDYDTFEYRYIKHRERAKKRQGECYIHPSFGQAAPQKKEQWPSYFGKAKRASLRSQFDITESRLYAKWIEYCVHNELDEIQPVNNHLLFHLWLNKQPWPIDGR
ncbi:MAG: hypothetical protein ABI380_08865 [Edaphobacter sp.]